MTTAIIAEDEPLMRDRLRQCLAEVWPELDIVGAAGDGDTALALAEELRPDVAFLDIRMPGKSGLDVAAAIGDRVHVVFTTAYDDYAIAAFDRGAVDYLLKPIETVRLRTAMARIRRRLAAAPAAPDADLARIIASLRDSIQSAEGGAPQRLRWIKASLGNQIKMLAVADVVYFQSDAKYTRVVLADSEALIRMTLKELLDGLDPEQFWQIHRGTIVNVSAIQNATREAQEKLTVQLKGRKEKLPVSRQFFHLFKQH